MPSFEANGAHFNLVFHLVWSLEWKGTVAGFQDITVALARPLANEDENDNFKKLEDRSVLQKRCIFQTQPITYIFPPVAMLEQAETYYARPAAVLPTL